MERIERIERQLEQTLLKARSARPGTQESETLLAKVAKLQDMLERACESAE